MITALLVIAIPVFYLLSDFSLDSSHEVKGSQAKDAAIKMVNEAREIFYMGKYSKEIITINLPDNINGMSSLIIVDTDPEYYLIINYSVSGRQVDMPISSEVPIITRSGCDFEANCYPGKDCYYCDFDPIEYAGGIRSMLIETIPGWNGMTVVNISQVEW